MPYVPTGRPTGRPKTSTLVQVSIKLDRALVAEARAYTARHGTTLAQLLREGLLIQLTPARTEVRGGVPYGAGRARVLAFVQDHPGLGREAIRIALATPAGPTKKAVAQDLDRLVDQGKVRREGEVKEDARYFAG
jgi:hypothetical protein